jgi:hypothetical protein
MNVTGSVDTALTKTTNEYSDYVFHALMISLGVTFVVAAIATITHGLCKLRQSTSPIQPWPPSTENRSRNGSILLVQENPIHVLTNTSA